MSSVLFPNTEYFVKASLCYSLRLWDGIAITIMFIGIGLMFIRNNFIWTHSDRWKYQWTYCIIENDASQIVMWTNKYELILPRWYICSWLMVPLFVYLNYRFERRHRNMSVHLSPCFRDVSLGDVVTVGECRPLSKTVRFNVLKVTKAPGTKKQFQKM